MFWWCGLRFASLQVANASRVDVPRGASREARKAAAARLLAKTSGKTPQRPCKMRFAVQFKRPVFLPSSPNIQVMTVRRSLARGCAGFVLSRLAGGCDSRAHTDVRWEPGG